MKIPKIIHMIWFGKKEMSEEIKKYVATWKEKCPDYEVMLWNEDNFDVNACQFAREAYENKKYAFVSDYVRLKVLYEYGGIYLDTDVGLEKSFDDFLDVAEGVLSFENDVWLGTAVIARVHNSAVCLASSSCNIACLIKKCHTIAKADKFIEN